MNFLDKKIYFVGGKGGVGKSTTSAALAYTLADENKRVLLISTDPAHNLGDLFLVKSYGQILKIKDRLSILEINSEQESRRYISEVKKNIKGLVNGSMASEVDRQIDLAGNTPGAVEAALFDRMTSLILEEIENYDAIVFDTAPTGHTIRLLTLPQLMGVWMDGLLERRRKVNEKNYHLWMDDGDTIEDPIYEKLQERKRKFTRVREILLDHYKTEYVFVLNAERLPILETKKAIEILKQQGIDVETIIVNKLIPENADGIFMEKRKENERHYRQEIKTCFQNKRKVMIPLLDTDISTLSHLQKFAEYLKRQLSTTKTASPK